jgi:flagellar basal-body rod modification protein FlgD
MHTNWVNNSKPASNINAVMGENGKGRKVQEKKSLSDFETFMKIMAVQLQNQDPTNPVKNTEYVSQLAQMKSLSQLQGLSNMVMINSAYNLIGKSVTCQTTDAAGKLVSATGTAQAVVNKGNVPYLLVNGGLVKVSDVIMVAPAENPNGKK